ncbi:sodium channel [Branchiostoma belcheri]|nr:sodium channel [Branchiostoma belcheri]
MAQHRLVWNGTDAAPLVTDASATAYRALDSRGSRGHFTGQSLSGNEYLAVFGESHTPRTLKNPLHLSKRVGDLPDENVTYPGHLLVGSCGVVVASSAGNQEVLVKTVPYVVKNHNLASQTTTSSDVMHLKTSYLPTAASRSLVEASQKPYCTALLSCSPLDPDDIHYVSVVFSSMLTSDEKTPEREFMDNTTLHGFNKIHHPNRAIRTVWIVAMLAAYAGFIYMAVNMAQTYFSYDTVCDVKLSFESKMTFPAVTICNYNRHEGLKRPSTSGHYNHPSTETGDTTDFLQPMIHCSRSHVCYLRDVTGAVDLIDSHKLTWEEWSILSTLLYGRAMDVPTLQAFLGPTFTDRNRTTNGTVTNATTMDMAAAVRMKGFDISPARMCECTMDMAAAVRMKGFDISPARMYLCSFAGDSCTEMNYTHSFSNYGNCYTFNADAANKLNQTIPGSTMGFQVVVNVMADSYTETMAVGGHEEVGLKFLIHDQNEPPMVETHGLAIKPGIHSFVSVKRTETHGLAIKPGIHSFVSVKTTEYYNHVPPWGDCHDKALTYFDAYTLPGCNAECRGKHVQDRCGCKAYYLPGSAPPCAADVLFTCVQEVLAEVNEGKLTCDCPLPCTMVKYSPTLDNVVALTVYYEDFSYMKISQLKAMDSGQLGCNMGGMMGLFIGASVLTLVELTEYLVARLSISWGKKKRPLSVHVQPAADSEMSEKKQPPDSLVFHK